MQKLTAILLCTLLVAGSITVVIDFGQSADAMKAQKKSPKHSHVHNRGNQVCGDELCPGQPWVKRVR